MARILLVEDTQDLGLYEARLLEAEGHHVLRCWGGPTPFAACPMMRNGSCPLPDAADLIIFSCGLYGSIRHRTYRGIHLLRAYRDHPDYGRLPMIVVAFGVPEDIGGSGPLEKVEKFADPKGCSRGRRPAACTLDGASEGVRPVLASAARTDASEVEREPRVVQTHISTLFFVGDLARAS